MLHFGNLSKNKSLSFTKLSYVKLLSFGQSTQGNDKSSAGFLFLTAGADEWD